MAAVAEITADDLEALAMRIAAEHHARSEAEANAVSRAALTAWREPVPKALAATSDDLVAEHTAEWLQAAEAAISVADWREFHGGRTFHVVDFRQLRIRDESFGLAVGCQLHELIDDIVPRRVTSRPVAAVAVNVAGLATELKPEAHEVAWFGAVVLAVAIHEYAHHAEFAARGIHVPLGSVATVREALRAKNLPTNQAAHNANWLRAGAHLHHRSQRSRWQNLLACQFQADANQAGVDATDVLEVLAHELEARADDRLVEVLRTPAPVQYLTLFGDATSARNS